MMVLRRVGAGHIFNLILIGSAWQVMHCASEKTDFPSTGEVLWYNLGYRILDQVLSSTYILVMRKGWKV